MPLVTSKIYLQQRTTQSDTHPDDFICKKTESSCPTRSISPELHSEPAAKNTKQNAPMIETMVVDFQLYT